MTETLRTLDPINIPIDKVRLYEVAEPSDYMSWEPRGDGWARQAVCPECEQEGLITYDDYLCLLCRNR